MQLIQSFRQNKLANQTSIDPVVYGLHCNRQARTCPAQLTTCAKPPDAVQNLKGASHE